ncbi:MAG TPA: hypothetical protein VEM39_12515 [Myxococcaceae bacterium]|nr:hypothetical protein [Myxococcaceae bacterium]
MAGSASGPQSPYCRELRSKQFYLHGGLATEAAHYVDGESDHCWCFETQQVIGPDGARAGPERCIPGRGCYRSALSDLE